MDAPAVAAALAAGAIAAVAGAGDSVVSPTAPFGWLGAVLLALLGAFTLWRSGSVKAWKETAEARDGRIRDLERELAEMRAELAIPERIEGLVRLMSETAEKQDAAALSRLELALERVDERWSKHDTAAEHRTQRLERGHDRIEDVLASIANKQGL